MLWTGSIFKLTHWRDFLIGEIFHSCIPTVLALSHFQWSVFIIGEHLVSATQIANNSLFSCGGVAVGHAGGSPRSLESKVHVGPGPRLVLDAA